MKQFRQAIFLCLLLSFQMAQARTMIGSGTFKNSGGQQSTRWTLADWLTQKQSFRLMDEWLAVNRTIGIFEINVDAGHYRYDVNLNGEIVERNTERYGASIFWSIFGLEYQFEKSSENFKRESGQFTIRVLGTNSQGSHLNLSYGVRKWTFEDPTNEVTNNYAAAKLNLYLVSFLGLEGKYNHYFKGEDDSLTSYEGKRVEYGIFIDIDVVRLYGTAFKETTEKTTAAGVFTSEDREGTEVGIKLYL